MPAAHDMKIVDVYREEGVSGTKQSTDRPAWSQLMTMLHSNGVRTVIVEKLDRLARNLMVQETIIADLHKSGFELVSAAEPDLMANNPTRILVRQMMAVPGCVASVPDCGRPGTPRREGFCGSAPASNAGKVQGTRPGQHPLRLGPTNRN
jgi:hypothetical protein